jgi:hypothetical protein
VQYLAEVCSHMGDFKPDFILDADRRVDLFEESFALMRPIELDKLRIIIYQVFACFYDAYRAV